MDEQLMPCVCGNTDIEPLWLNDIKMAFGGIAMGGGILYAYGCPNCRRVTRECRTREESVDAWNSMQRRERGEGR